MLQQVFLDSKYADYTYANTGDQVHWLSDAIEKPAGYYFKVHLISCWIPLTYYNLFPGNNHLDISYGAPGVNRINFGEGNRDIDYLLEIIQNNLQNGFVVSYDPATNKVSFDGGSSIIFIESTSTCLGLLGFEANQVGFGQLTAAKGVDLTRTSSILIRSNLHGTNRDPFTKRMSDILCKVPVTREQPNEIIEYSQPAVIRITNPSIDHFVLGLYDDDDRPISLNGNRWTCTIQVSIERDESHDLTIPRYLPTETPPDDKIGDGQEQPKGKPKDKASG
jgi:hypothetical protein